MHNKRQLGVDVGREREREKKGKGKRQSKETRTQSKLCSLQTVNWRNIQATDLKESSEVIMGDSSMQGSQQTCHLNRVFSLGMGETINERYGRDGLLTC